MSQKDKILKIIQTEIKQEKLKEGYVYYSLGQKANKNIGSQSKILLLNCINQNVTYYHKNIKLPFAMQGIQPPVKKSVHIDKLLYVRTDNKISFKEVIQKKQKSQNNQQTPKTQEKLWDWTFKNPELASKWVQRLDSFKKQLQPKVEESPKIKVDSKIKQSTVNKNKNQYKEQTNLKMRDSNINVGNSKIKQSIIINRQNNESRISNKPESNLKQSSNFRISDIENKKQQVSNIKPNRTSEIKKQSQIKNYNNRISDNQYNNQQQSKYLRPNRNTEIQQRKKSQIIDYSVNAPPIYQDESSEDWNNLFLKDNSLETIMRFRKYCENIAKNLIDELSQIQVNRKNPPQSSSASLETYKINNLQIKLSFIGQDQSSQRILKNQFRNYNYFLACTKNQGLLRVPLSCIVQYKGIICFLKASINDGEIISPNASILNELIELEKLTNIKKQVFYNQQNVILKKVQKKKGETFVYVDQFHGFLPYDILATKQYSQFRPQSVLQNEISLLGGYIDQQNRIDRITQKALSDLGIMSKNIIQDSEMLLNYCQNLQVMILNTKQLKTQMNLNGINTRHINHMYKKCSVLYLKRCLISEMTARVCKTLVRIHIQQEIRNMSLRKDKNNQRESTKQSQLLNKVYQFLNDLLSGNQQSEKIWRIVTNEVKRNYNTVLSRSELEIGYFLSSLFAKLNLKLNYKYFNKDKQYFKSSQVLRKEFIEGFNITTKSYDIKFTPELTKIQSILNADSQNKNDYQTLKDTLNLESGNIPQYCKIYGYQNRIKIYMAYFQNYQPDNQKNGINIYETIFEQPPTKHSVKLAYMALKWAIKDKNTEQIQKIYDQIQSIVGYWANQSHPILNQFHDLISKYNLSQGDTQNSINLGKKILSNIIKIFGNNNALCAAEYENIGNIYFELKQKAEAINYYVKSKQLLKFNNKTDSVNYAAINKKLSVLFLNTCNTKQSIECSLQALKIYEKLQTQESSLLQTYQLLARAYEISNKYEELTNLANDCSKKFNNTESIDFFERILKISVYSCISTLAQTNKSALLSIVKKFLVQIQNQSKEKQAAFQYLHERSSKQNISNLFINKINKIDKIAQQINQKKLISKYSGFRTDTKSQGQAFLTILQSIGSIIDFNFLLGILSEEKL